MVFPPLFALNNGLINFNPGIEYRYAMGMGAPLMLGWTILLLWADRKPMERKDILLITLLVVLGEVATEMFGVDDWIHCGFLDASDMGNSIYFRRLICFQLLECVQMNHLIDADNLYKHFGETRAVDGFSVHIQAGEIYGLVGSDGAGKTTTMRLLCGALRADSGKAVICGYNVAKQTENARSQLGYLSQRFSMYEELTVLENIRFFAEIRGMKPDEWLPRCMEILEFVGLAHFKDRRAGQLSGGMKQKLGLASALVTRPRVLLLDEPTTGVDPVTRQDFWQLLISLVSTSLHLSPNTTASDLGGVSRQRERMRGRGSRPHLHSIHGRSRALQPSRIHASWKDHRGRNAIRTAHNVKGSHS